MWSLKTASLNHWAGRSHITKDAFGHLCIILFVYHFSWSTKQFFFFSCSISFHYFRCPELTHNHCISRSGCCLFFYCIFISLILVLIQLIYSSFCTICVIDFYLHIEMICFCACVLYQINSSLIVLRVSKKNELKLMINTTRLFLILCNLLN